MKNILLVALIFSIALPAWGGNKKQFHHIASGKTTIDSATLEGTAIKAVISTSPFYPNVTFMPEMLWGSGFTSPTKVISSLVLYVSGQEVGIPFSAFADLAEPREVFLDTKKSKEIVLTIIGADAGSAYKAVLNFKYEQSIKKFRIASRRVVHQEFSLDVWEETTYSWNKSNN